MQSDYQLQIILFPWNSTNIFMEIQTLLFHTDFSLHCFSGGCECKYPEVFTFPCVHMLKAAQELGFPIPPRLAEEDTLAKWREQYSDEVIQSTDVILTPSLNLKAGPWNSP